MIILRLFLYLICVISIGWSVLVFGGPPIIKRLISVYSDGTLISSGVTVSPKLNLSISRLELNVQNEIAGWHIEGFSRAIELTWSIFGEKPFLEVNLGPSVLKDYAMADSVNFFTPSLKKIDWQNLALFADINNLALNSFSKIGSLTLTGNLNLGSGKVSNVKIDAEKFSSLDGSLNYSAQLLTGDLAELNFNAPLTEQLISSAFEIENIIVAQPNVNVPQATLEILFDEQSRNFKLNLHDLKLLEVGGSIESLKVDGYLNQSNALQEIHIASKDSIPFEKSPKFPEISARIKKSGDKQYKAYIEGNFEEFELSDSDNYIGLLPSGNFVNDLEIDRAVPSVTSTAKINFSTESSTEIFGFIDLGFSSEISTDLECAVWDCELTNFNLLYRMNFDDEWIKGRANCLSSHCKIIEMDHVVTTSNTNNVFKILSQTKILNPLTSFYLFGAISSGQKINDGHELKFQF